MKNCYKNIFLFTLSTIVFMVMVNTKLLFPNEKPKSEQKKGRLAKSLYYDPEVFAILNINNLWMWERQDGKSNHSAAGRDGVVFPRATTHAIYQDGIVWGSKAYLDADHTQSAPFDQLIRVGGASYGTGCLEGWIIGQGADAVAVDHNDPRARIYRIRRDWKNTHKDANGSWTNIALQDASDCFERPVSDIDNEEMQLIWDQYLYCWDNWPVDLGAPFIDRNKNGIYDPPPADFTAQSLIEGGYDEPGVAGADPDSPADMVIWNVYNDLNKSMRFGSHPTGLEIQNTVWGYNKSNALGNCYFRRIKIINQGGVDVGNNSKGSFYLNDMYVTQWSDPDLGDAGDDLVGCDTVLSLGYVYNGNTVDNLYMAHWLAPPAAGYDFLQGPAISSPGDIAVFDLKYKQNYKNLGMSSFAYFGAGSPFGGPILSNTHYVTGALRWYKMMRGYDPLSDPDAYYDHPPGVQPGPFPLSGDPVAGTGHLDGLGEDWSWLPGDRRLLCTTGPFQMAPGDTQEVVTALVCGLGGDRLSSISVLKYNDRVAQAIYNGLFSVPKPPKSPNVTIAELNDKVILEWGSDLSTVEETEKVFPKIGGYNFEGYNVYQLPTENSDISETKRIATYDLATDPTVVLDEQVEPASGMFLLTPVQFGSNSGIRREFVFDRDYLNDIDKINNGSDYYLAVTAYSVSTIPDFVPSYLESDLEVIKVVPQSRGLGEIIGSEYGQIIENINHTNGSGNAKITPIIIEPLSVTPADYTISWDADSTWKIAKEGTTLIKGLTNYSGDEDYPIIEGVKVKLEDVYFAALLDFPHPIIPGVDEFTYSTHGLEKTKSESLKQHDLSRIGVFPNPYYALNQLETSYVNKFVTFNNLPPKATIRIFNLAGHLINIIEKNNNSRFERWNLLNQSEMSVASGIYLAYINMPDENLTKILKLVIIMEAEFLLIY